MTTIVWFRQDLRLTDNPALIAAATRGPVVPVYIWSPEEEGSWPPGAASRVWLHHSLAALDQDLQDKGARLIVREGPALDTLRDLVKKTGATAVYWNRRYEPAAIERDKKIKNTLTKDGVETKSFNGSLLFEPWEIETQQGDPYKVFTPFWKACLARPEPPEPQSAPKKLAAPESWPKSAKLDNLGLLPKIDWDQGIREFWRPGEQEALQCVDEFLGERVRDYHTDRDVPAKDGTSRLSPYLHFGEVSPRTVWHETRHAPGPMGKGRETFARELGWREFGYHLIYHFPRTPDAPLRPEFKDFPWQRSRKKLEAWQQGKTGYPVVDAGMRQLWRIGWMHNRARMIVASFLVKDLRISWREGARWFWDTLVDADLANNTLGWQWAGGCGADAAPYFRVFNPTLQGEKFDPDGAYVRDWVPELSKLPNKWIHKPWEAPADVLEEAGVRLGDTYPKPIVDHAEAREQALAAFETIKKK